MTVAGKLYGGFGLVIALMAILSFVGIQRVGFIDHTLEEITDVNSVKQRYAINFRGSVHDRAIAIRDVVLYDDSQKIDQAVAQIRELEQFYAKSEQPMDAIFAKGTNVTQKERDILADIKAVQQRTLPLVEQIITLTRSGKDSEAKEVLLQEASQNFTQWLGVINEFIDHQEAKNQEATPKAREVASGFSMLMVSLLIVALIIGIAVAYFISSQLTKALGAQPQEVADIVAKVADGDLQLQKKNSYPNSTMDAVASMQKKLTQIVRQIKDASSTLAQKSDSVQNATNETSSVAIKQEKIATKLADDVVQISQSIQDIVTIAKNTESNSSQSAQLSQKGSRAATSTAGKMESVTQSVRHSADRVKMLDEHVQNISGSTTLIQEVTEQTNLLALNAAIEAARAGDAGRGFAVVAEEIRKLAEKTDKTTDEITRMVKLIQDETTQAVDEMEQVVSEVESSYELANEAAKMLEDIYSQTNESLSHAKETAEASTQQASRVQELSKDIEAIEKSSKSTVTAMQEGKKTVTELKKIAGDLQELMDYFKN